LLFRYFNAAIRYLSLLSLKSEGLSNVPPFATTGISHCKSALKLRLLTVAIRGTIIFFVAIGGLYTAAWHSPSQRSTFERGLPQQSEIQYQPFYNGSAPVATKNPVCGGFSRPKLSL
jgi:hypothetical protein